MNIVKKCKAQWNESDNSVLIELQVPLNATVVFSSGAKNTADVSIPTGETPNVINKIVPYSYSVASGTQFQFEVSQNYSGYSKRPVVIIDVP